MMLLVSVLEDIEEALVAQWSLFGRAPGASLHEEDGLVWFETPVRHLPYNAVIRTRVREEDADGALRKPLERFRSRGVDFMWLEHPTARPEDLGPRLEAEGLSPVETVTGMSLELEEWDPPETAADAAIERVSDEAGMREYTELTLGYWEIEDADERARVAEIHRHWRPGRAPGDRFLARRDGKPVGKAYLSLNGPDGVAAIYGMSVLPEARGRGTAKALTAALLKHARDAGRGRVVLHSTEMADRLYSAAGFEPRCEIRVFATDSLWSHEH